MSYDEKYKLRTISYRQEGHTLEQTRSVFKVSVLTIRKWEKQFREEGGFKKRPVRRPFKKIDPEKLRQYITEYPDAYLREIAAVFKCCQTAVRKALKRLKITRKKRLRVTPNKIRNK